jgi:NYN domain
MFGRSIRSSLFIDFENIGHRNLPDTIPNWMAWLELGEFDTSARRRRRFVAKRIYWNSAAEHLRKQFEACGFDPILCPKFAGLKNGADIKMAMDIVETARDNPRIKEFILVTKDSDFVPVLQRLRKGQRRTAVLADQNDPARFTTYRQHADIVIPVRAFIQAAAFTRPPSRNLVRRAVNGLTGALGRAAAASARQVGGLRRRFSARRAEKRAAAEQAAAAAAQAAAAAERAAAAARRDVEQAAATKTRLEAAVDAAIRITSLRPNMATARKEIMRELVKIRGFARTGRNPFFGFGSYRGLMEEIAKKVDRIRIVDAGNGGITVTYVPKDEE